jgi:hypothetical protein
VVPLPNLLVTRIDPLCRVMIWCATARPRSVPERLVGEERLEDSLHDLGRHSRTIVRHGESDHVAFYCGGDADRSALRHGMTGVDDQVRQDLLYLGRVNAAGSTLSAASSAGREKFHLVLAATPKTERTSYLNALSNLPSVRPRALRRPGRPDRAEKRVDHFLLGGMGRPTALS